MVDHCYTGFALRPLDDIVPTRIAELFSYEVYKSPIYLDGGNYMMDSKGNLFTTKRTYMWNRDISEPPCFVPSRHVSWATKVHAIEYAGYPEYPADTTGHIDMFAKLLNDETVLIASTSDEEPFKTNGERAIAYFKSIKTPSGNRYKILTVPGWVQRESWYNYVNSLIVNNVVIVPSYANRTVEEGMVKKTYEEGMPGVKVIFASSDSTITRGGSIHCLNKRFQGYNYYIIVLLFDQ